jgi:hypothetical protein
VSDPAGRLAPAGSEPALLGEGGRGDSPVSTHNGVRAATPGELCTCGRPADRVVLAEPGDPWGDTGYCGLDDGGAPAEGVCTFCGDTIDHDAYGRAEQDAGRPFLAYVTDGRPQGGRCPLYRLRLADPLPPVHTASIKVFDPETDRRERSEARLRIELTLLLEAAGADYDGTYQLMKFDDEDDDETGNLADVVFDICWATRQALGNDPDGADTREPGAGQTAVAVTVVMLRARLDELGIAPNPLDGLDAAGLIERAGGDDAWSQTIACDRPLLIVRRVVRRALQPEAPTDIYRQWWS